MAEIVKAKATACFNNYFFDRSSVVDRAQCDLRVSACAKYSLIVLQPNELL